MDIDKLLSAAADYGFPMLVSSYLLVRMEGRIEKQGKANRGTSSGYRE